MKFPPTFTAFSHLLELRAKDTVDALSGSVSLPISGSNVNIETWKLATNTMANLAVELNNIKNYLVSNENSIGPYIHGNRFVAFLRDVYGSGMEYDGGTTSSPDALSHETFHSWWGRGIKPASQPDGWFDEAITTYNDQGASASQSFNFADQPILLRQSNPWARVTSGNAYTDGCRFLKGIAAKITANTMNNLLDNFYKKFRKKSFTTMNIEEYLTSRSGNPQIVDAFHRFVYGYADPATAPKLWLKDAPGHTGSDLWQGRFWDSPDLWVRNSDDGFTQHQSPKFGQDNWFFARVRNNGTSTVNHFVVTFNVKQFAGVQFSYPNDFLPCTAAASGFDLAPGASVIVKARWPKALVPNVHHACLLSAVLTKGDQPLSGRHVWEQNNLAQKNLTIANLHPDQWIIVPVVAVNSYSRSRKYYLEVVKPPQFSELEVSILHNSKKAFRKQTVLQETQIQHSAESKKPKLLDCSGFIQHQVSEEANAESKDTIGPSDDTQSLGWNFEVKFAKTRTSSIPVFLGPQEQVTFGLRAKAPINSKKGDVVRLDLVKRERVAGPILGGIAIQIQVV